MKDGFQINEISKFFNVPASTLRYWEEMGVLAAKKNPENGYRIYTVSDLMTISDILFYKNLGIPLKKIRDMEKMDLQAQQVPDRIRAFEVITDRQPQRKSIRRQALHWR